MSVQQGRETSGGTGGAAELSFVLAALRAWSVAGNVADELRRCLPLGPEELEARDAERQVAEGPVEEVERVRDPAEVLRDGGPSPAVEADDGDGQQAGQRRGSIHGQEASAGGDGQPWTTLATRGRPGRHDRRR